ncbi:HAMP domain-containing histidine kinase [Thermoactinomyces daqus]|uniref:histidine kinase n=3 Tax=Thermoactinomyces TaxID=2023 RepID=A0A7W1XC16_9BACL|nr:HAMP domain-containing sensor histidine kinase [Thermoactinomyces daqus]MBA4543804.1 HAMP domain-containing histidine kinase [Thermoactinomyces daqus]
MIRRFFEKIYHKIAASLRAQFILYILISMLAAAIAVEPFAYINQEKRYYYPSRDELEMELKKITPLIQQAPPRQIRFILDEKAEASGTKLRLISQKGTVLVRSANATEQQMNPAQILMKISQQNEEPSNVPQFREIYAIHPFYFHHQIHYLVISKETHGRLTTYWIGNPLLSVVVFFLVFIVVYLILTRRKLKQLQEVTAGISEIAKGNFRLRLKEQGKDEIAFLAAHVNEMARQLKANWEKERRMEQERTDLITSISHDLRTPLTSVIGYLKLIHDQSQLTPDEMKKYADIALSKSKNLKQMMDQLFEFTKITHDQFQPSFQLISLNELINQLLEGNHAMLALNEMDVERIICNDPLQAQADPFLLIRMFDNLIQNALKYGKKPGKFIIVTKQEDGYGVIKLSNTAGQVDRQIIGRLFQMFVTGDPSRSEKRSGIGLAIVKRIVDLHQGQIAAIQENGMMTFVIKLPITSSRSFTRR